MYVICSKKQYNFHNTICRHILAYRHNSTVPHTKKILTTNKEFINVHSETVLCYHTTFPSHII